MLNIEIKGGKCWRKKLGRYIEVGVLEESVQETAADHNLEATTTIEIYRGRWTKGSVHIWTGSYQGDEC